MVNRGFVAPERVIPAPDMSFVRLFNDDSIGWQQRGQYAMWTGASSAPSPKFRLLQRVGNRVALIEHADGSPVFHKIGAGVAFMIENHMDSWLAFDSDAMWLDTPCADGRYAVLAVGGSAGKPGAATLDWMCPHCGAVLNRHELNITPHAFTSMLKKAEKLAAEFNSDRQLRTCDACETVHPITGQGPMNEVQMPSGGRN